MATIWMKLKTEQRCHNCSSRSKKLSMEATDYAGLAGCTMLAFVLYLNTLNAGFVYDDRRAILGNADVTGAGPLAQLLQNDYWGTPLTDSGSHGSWRPLCVLSFRLNFLLGSGAAFPFHLINLLLHGLATALVVLVARTLLPTRAGVWAASALFAAHPIHTEAVAGVVGRADLSACVCSLFAYLTYRRHMLLRDWRSLAVTLLAALAALLCKETAITTLLLCGLCDVLCGLGLKHAGDDKHRLRSLSILSIALLCAVYCRLSIVPRPTVAFSAADNPTAHESCWWTRTLSFLYLPVVNLKLLLWPQYLSFDWGMEAIPRIRTLWDSRNVLSAGFYATLLAVSCKCIRLRCSAPRSSMDYAAVASISLPLLQRLGGNSCQAWHGLVCGCHHQLKQQRSPQQPSASVMGTSSSACCLFPGSATSASESVLVICIGFLVLPFLPACNLFFHVGFVLAERLLYLPSVGYCLLLGLGFGKLWQRLNGSAHRLLLLICLGILLVTFGLRTVQRNRDWHNEEQLFRSAVAINPPKALGNLGSVLSTQGRYEEARLALESAIAYRPNMADAHFNLGIVHQQQQNYSAALPCYRRAIELRPQLALAYLNLATSLLAWDKDRHEEAGAMLLAGARLPGHGVRDRNAHEEARYSAYLQLSALHRSRGRHQQAVEVLNEALAALSMDKRKQRAVLHQRLAAVHVELEQWPEAEEQQRLALQLQPEEGVAYVSYGQALARNCSRYAEAELWFKRAVELSPLEPSTHHHYADFLEQQQRPQEALGYRLRAAALAPHNYALQSAVADAMRLLNRLAEAELWYRQAAALHPQAAHAHANLGAILQMRGQRQQAVECYRRALQLQPGHATSRANLAKMNVNIDAST
ncbi:protein O-mannosyl-transferase Tmtc1 isoform X1 [Drosophila montana]|uniref:protein O-mannosyl-transferase Tmtc1 isoform X1 n=1 Tax=Drosophila montana TaxID=40370 RepID=UPI00313AEAF9